MDEYDAIIDKIAPPAQPVTSLHPRKPQPTENHLADLTGFIQERGLQVGPTTGGRHNAGSLHYSGNAVDIHNSGGMTDAQVAELSQAASERGFKLRDERVRPPGQKVWSAPHVHIEYAGQNPYDQVIDKVAPSKQATQATADPYDEAVDKISPIVQSTTTPQSGTSTVSLGEGAEMASADEMRAYNRAHPTDQILNVPQPRIELPNKPLEFQGARNVDTAQGSGLAALTVPAVNHLVGGEPPLTGADKLLADKYHAPPSRELGQPVTFSGQGDPVESYLKALGPEYLALNESYRQQTGRNLVEFTGNVPLTADEQGNITVQPTRRSFDLLNVYAEGVKAGGPEEGLKRLKTWGGQTTDIENQAARQAQTEAAPNIAALESERKQFGGMNAPVRSIAAPTQRFGAGIIKELGGIASLGGIAPNKLSEYLNTRGSVLQEGATMAPLNAQGQEMVRGLPEKAVSAIGDLGFSVGSLIALKKASGLSLGQIMAIEAGLKNSDRPMSERAPAIAQAYAMGKVLDVPMGRIMSAGVFGVPTAVEGIHVGQKPEDIALNTAVQAGAGALLGHGEGERPTELGIENAPISGVRGRGALDAESSRGAYSEDGQSFSLKQLPLLRKPRFDPQHVIDYSNEGGDRAQATPYPKTAKDIATLKKEGHDPSEFIHIVEPDGTSVLLHDDWVIWPEEQANTLAQREANVSPEGLKARQVMHDAEPVHHSNLQPRTAEGQFDGPPISESSVQGGANETSTAPVVSPVEATQPNSVNQASGTPSQEGVPEINIPESQDTIQGQVDERGFTFVPNENKGTIKQPRGTRALKRAEGVIYYDPKRITDTGALKTTPLSDLLGHLESKSAATTEAVVARNADGTEIQSSATSPENVPAQIAETQGRLPNTQVGVELPENVIADRVAGQSERATTGIAHRVNETQGIAAERGQGVSPEQSVVEGREKYTPEKAVRAIEAFESDPERRVSEDMFQQARAHKEVLARATNRVADTYGENSPEYKAANKAEQDWVKRIKPLQTEWSKHGAAQQGETEIDAGTFHGLRRAVTERIGRDLTPQEASKAKDLSTRVATLERQVQETSDALKAALDKTNEPSTTRSNRPSRAPRLERIDVYFDRMAQEAQARLNARAGKAKAELAGSNKGQRGAAINSADVAESIKDWGIIGAAKLAKRGVNFAQWSADMVKDFGEEVRPHLDKIFMESRRLMDEKRAADRQPPSAETVRNAEAKRDLDQKAREITKRQATAELSERLSKGGKVIPEDGKAVWAHMRDYVDRGEEFDNAIQKTATDLGINPDQVRRAITQQAGTRRITDDLYRQMAARRAARSQAEVWAANVDAPMALKAFRVIRDGMFNIKIAGGLHGTVGPITHAGENLFHPTRVADYVKNVGRTWRAVVDSGYHERAMRDLENDPNYTIARRAGLKNEPRKVYDDYQNSMMGRLLGVAGQAGNRGFDVLKIMRQDFFNHEWDKLADSQKSPEMAQRIAQVMNGATGASDFKGFGSNSKSPLVRELGRSVMFAGPLEGSRWNRLVKDPAEAIGIASKLATKAGRESVSAADKYFLKKQIKEKAGFAATYAAALALNQGLLMATGSKDRVNLTDPSKGDWLRFKVRGRAIEPTGGIISTIDFLGKLANIAAGKQNPQEGRGSRLGHALYNYSRGKLSPIASTGMDAVTQSDYRERPVPWSSDKKRKGKPRYTWPEYLLTQQSPIPFSEGIRDVYSTMHNSGVPTPTINSILRGAAIGTFSGATGIKIGEEYPERPTGRTRAVRSNQPRTRTARP